MKRMILCVVLAAGFLLAVGCCTPGGPMGGCDWMCGGSTAAQPCAPAPVTCQ